LTRDDAGSLPGQGLVSLSLTQTSSPAIPLRRIADCWRRKMKLCATFGISFALLALSGCGPLMDLRDAIGPTRYGPMTPYGQIKHDFWGNTYIEPYPQPPRESVPDKQGSDPSPKE